MTIAWIGTLIAGAPVWLAVVCSLPQAKGVTPNFARTVEDEDPPIARYSVP